MNKQMIISAILGLAFSAGCMNSSSGHAESADGKTFVSMRSENPRDVLAIARAKAILDLSHARAARIAKGGEYGGFDGEFRRNFCQGGACAEMEQDAPAPHAQYRQQAPAASEPVDASVTAATQEAPAADKPESEMTAEEKAQLALDKHQDIVDFLDSLKQ